MKLQVTKESLREQIVAALRDEIINGQISPGQQLVERQLSARFGVSVAPVREALLRLVHEGFLDSVTHRGVTVARKASEETCEILTKMRIELEATALKIGFSDFDVENLALWQTTLQQLQIACQELNAEEIVRLDFAFHRSLFEMSPQSELLVTWMTTMSRVRLNVKRVAGSVDNAMLIYHQHSRFFEHCQTRQLENALAMLKENILTEVSDMVPETPSLQASSRKQTEHGPLSTV